jgi:hypothetical protein
MIASILQASMLSLLTFLRYFCSCLCATVRLRGNRDHMAGAAVQEVVLESTLVSRPGLAPTQLLLPERVRLAQLPLCRPARFSVHAEVAPGQYGDFTMLQQQPYKVCA